MREKRADQLVNLEAWAERLRPIRVRNVEGLGTKGVGWGICWGWVEWVRWWVHGRWWWRSRRGVGRMREGSRKDGRVCLDGLASFMAVVAVSCFD